MGVGKKKKSQDLSMKQSKGHKVTKCKGGGLGAGTASEEGLRGEGTDLKTRIWNPNIITII